MADELVLKEEQPGDVPQVISQPLGSEPLIDALIDELVGHYSQIRQEQTKRAVAQLIQLARSFDLGDAHMSALFYEALHDLLFSGAELDAGLRNHLEKLLGQHPPITPPPVIEGDVIVVENE